MDALEVQIDDDCIMTFDGHVLERFGYQSADRYHVRLLVVEVAGPDKRGIRTVKLKHSGGPGGGGIVFTSTMPGSGVSGRCSTLWTAPAWRYPARSRQVARDVGALRRWCRAIKHGAP